MKYLCALLLSTAFLLTGCGEADDATRTNDFVPLTGITITSAATKVPVGFTNQFTANGNFSDIFTRPITSEITWLSSAPGILTFDDPSSGLGKGVSPGPVTVTASSDGVSGTFEFTVSDATLSSIAVTPPAASIAKGRTQQFVATGTFSDLTTLNISTQVSWTSTDTAIVTVDTAGLAKAEAVGGPATITAGYPKDAAAPSVTDNAQMTVTAAVVESITISPESPVLIRGQNLQFKAVANYSDGTEPDVSSQASWTSSTPATATINASGLVTAVADGETRITAAFSDKSVNTVLTVGAIASIEITPANPSVSIGNTQQLTATATLTDNSTLDITTMADWSANNTNVTVNNTVNKGLVTGNTQGTTQVTASMDSKNNTITVTVP